MRGYRLWLFTILVIAVLSAWMSVTNPHIGVLGMDRNVKVVQGLDLQGGSRVLLQVASGVDFTDATMDQARKNVERRVNGLGVTDAVVQQQGANRIMVELPGVKEQKVAFDSIKSTGLLEFVDFSAVASGSVAEDSCILTSEQVALAESRLTGDAQPLAYDQYTCPSEDPNDPTPVPVQLQNGQPFRTIMTGAGLEDAAADTAGQIGTQWLVRFVIKQGADRVDDFVQYVADNPSRPMAIVLDGRLISYPTIQADLSEAASAGTMDAGVITGGFTRDEARVLAAQLKYGALPVPLDIIAFDTIGPSLGQRSVDRSIRAGIIGVITVLMFMLIYYRVPGFAAALALLLFAAINFALYKFIPVTLSLPAITGFLISIGTAVDGNILIFERMKEELRRGRSMDSAIEAGFERAWTSIRDSNISTIIIAFILFWFGRQFGASAVQGFAITLGMGLVINLFTAVIVTRTFLHTLLLVAGNQLRTNPRLLGV